MRVLFGEPITKRLTNGLRRSLQFFPTWLEEPLSPDAVGAYGALTDKEGPSVPIAAGEGSNTYRMAEDLIVHGGIQFVQIDAGRIGGIMPSFQGPSTCRTTWCAVRQPHV